jgi:hypothetical protein
VSRPKAFDYFPSILLPFNALKLLKRVKNDLNFKNIEILAINISDSASKMSIVREKK